MLNNWIKIEQKLPGKNDIVLAICLKDINEYSYPFRAEEAMYIAFYSNGKWWDEKWPEVEKEDNIIEDVTHWMPLPEPPPD